MKGLSEWEKQRAYRERMKARLGKEFLKKERERVKKACTLAALLNKKELAVRHKQQNKWQRKCRALKKVQQTTLSMDAWQGASRKNEAQENSAVVEPMIVQLDFNKKHAKANIQLTRKRVKRQASKAYRKIANQEEEKKKLQKKVHKYRKAAYRKSINASSPSPNSSHTPSSLDRMTEEISSKNICEVNMVDLTPRSQAEHDLNELGIRGQNAEKIRKKLIAHNALVAEIKDASHPLAGKRRQALHGFVMGKIVKKYRVVNLIRKEIGGSKNVLSRLQKKTMTSSPKKSRLFQWHATMKGKIIDFLKRGDNSTCLPEKWDSKKVGDQQLQKYILNDYLENLHIKFLAENLTVHLSYSTFTRMRPKEIIPVSCSSRETCLCEKHQNFSLKKHAIDQHC